MTQPITTNGFGVLMEGALLIRTVSNSPRAAMLNGMALIFDLWASGEVEPSDDVIRETWYSKVRDRPIYIVPVTVAATAGPIAIGDDIGASADGHPDRGYIQ